MLNISPIGRNCSKEERNDYERLDLVSAPHCIMFVLTCVCY
jgi:hypothetical protein